MSSPSERDDARSADKAAPQPRCGGWGPAKTGEERQSTNAGFNPFDGGSNNKRHKKVKSKYDLEDHGEDLLIPHQDDQMYSSRARSQNARPIQGSNDADFIPGQGGQDQRNVYPTGPRGGQEMGIGMGMKMPPSMGPDQINAGGRGGFQRIMSKNGLRGRRESYAQASWNPEMRGSRRPGMTMEYPMGSVEQGQAMRGPRQAKNMIGLDRHIAMRDGLRGSMQENLSGSGGGRRAGG